MIILTPETVEQAFVRLNLPFRFTAEERNSLQLTTDVVSIAGRVLAFPTPAANEGLNVLNMRRIIGVNPAPLPVFFDHPWYLDEPFGTVNCAPGWHVMQMDVPAHTLERPYHYSSSLSAARLTLPAAVEVVLMLFLHYLETGEQLLLKKHTWCRDEASMGRFVTVGAFGRNGVFVSSHPPAFASRGLGICGKRINSPVGEPSR